MKIMTVVGTRPELIRLSQLIKVLDEDTDHILVHTGQNYDTNLYETFLDDLGIRNPNYYLNVANENSSITISNIISAVSELIVKEKPDAFLILGDTNSCLSSIAAKKNKVPIFHLEAGNRCFDIRVPEEVNRKIVDHISDVNLTYSEISRDYLINEGLNPQTCIKVGSPMKEVISNHISKIQKSKILKQLGLEPQNYFLASFHREETVDNQIKFQKLLTSLEKLAFEYELKILVSTHPRTKKRLEDILDKFDPNIFYFCSPFNFTDYVNLQMNAKLVLSDSGTITEESSILDFPAINLRTTHERPEGDTEGQLILSTLNADQILNAAKTTLRHNRVRNHSYSKVEDYEVSNFSYKVSRIIQSYTPFIREYIYRESD